MHCLVLLCQVLDRTGECCGRNCVVIVVVVVVTVVVAVTVGQTKRCLVHGRRDNSFVHLDSIRMMIMRRSNTADAATSVAGRHQQQRCCANVHRARRSRGCRTWRWIDVVVVVILVRHGQRRRLMLLSWRTIVHLLLLLLLIGHQLIWL